MSDQEAFKKFMQQLQRAGSRGGGFSGGPKGFITGSGLLLALVAGGVALNASLFNGVSRPAHRTRPILKFGLKWMVVTVP
jgi:hypothetical protein